MTDRDRQLAEAMGWRECLVEPDRWQACSAFIEPRPFSPTTDARDCRELMQWVRESRHIQITVTLMLTFASVRATYVRDDDKIEDWFAVGLPEDDGPTYDLIAICRAILAALEGTNGEG